MNGDYPGMERRVYRILGRVQGVGFRWWARETAIRLGVRGTVRNLADGSVRVEALGELHRLDRLEEALRSGPSGAHVTGLEQEAPGHDELPRGFEIQR
jgi:acylphosphatase